MKKTFGLLLLLILLLIVGLLSVGCGQNDAEDQDVEEQNSILDNGSSESSSQGELRDIDYTDAEEVFIAFWAAFAAAEFDEADKFLTDLGSSELRVFRRTYEANPYALKIWQLLMDKTEIQVAAQGTTSDVTILNMEMTMPDFGEMEYLVDDPAEQEQIIKLFEQLSLSGFTGGMVSEFRVYGEEFDEGAWNTAFTVFEDVADRMPIVTGNSVIQLVMEEGRWMVDELPHFIFFLD